MRRKRSGATMVSRVILLFIFISISTCDGVRRNAQRRKDSYRSAPELRVPTPTAESLQALAEATGAAGFEHYTEGRALVKRLIPADSQSDVDMVEHQGVIGKAGVDFPAFPSIPNTGFSCKNVPTGYYADLETDCQVFHICDTSRKISFLCPNGTIFSQSHLICDWWFKVDCASSPALYESSAEYYSNEQKRTRKITKSLSKNSDLQQIGTDTNIRAESRRTSINVPSVPSTTERLLRHRQRLQSDFGSTLSNVKATARSFQALFADKNFNPTQKSQATTAFDKRRKNLVQLITNTFGNPTRTTLPTYPEASTYKTTVPVGDHNSIKEMQVAAETASFAANNNRQYLQDYNSKNFRPYPVYTPNVPKVSKTKSNPNLTTLYDIRDKHLDEYVPDSSTKRSTLIPYTKSYTNIINDKLEPYTRPGVSLLKGFLEKERNRTLTTTTQTFVQVTERSDQSENVYNNEKKITIESNNSFESATKIPQTTRADTTYFTDTSSSNINDIVAKSNESSQVTTEASYQERRERLLRKLNLETLDSTESTLPTGATEKFYGNLPNRPGLVVPPSLTPKTLHTLAIYYATALDNLSTTLSPEETETTIPSIDEYDNISDSLPSLFSRQTINKYDSLFGQGTNSAEILEEMRLDPNGTYNELVEDLAVQQSQNPLATSPQIRELAQVFTHALSAYLQDPVQFRKVLSDIRPTQPSFGDMYITTEESVDAEPTTTINEDDDEILGFSDDNKIRPVLASLRDSKALNIATDQPTTIQSSTDIKSTSPLATSAHNPFRCCGRISASYTTASVPKETTATPITFTNLSNNVSQVNANAQDNSYTISKYGGFQNNSVPHISPYGEGLNPIGAKPLNEYVQATNLPLEWGVDVSTSEPVNNALNLFESKKIKKTSHLPETTTPIYFTETDSVELENEEELQRAHSQSFVGPKNNELRHGKQLNLDETTTILQKPSDDLEVPTVSNIETTTIQVITSPTTQKIEDTESTTSSSEFSSIFTSPENDLRTTQEFQWPNLENWHSTIILDPFTVNDGLSSTGPDRGMHQLTDQTNSWTNNFATTPSTDYTEASEATSSPTINVEVSTPGDKIETRFGRLLKQPTATESGQDLTTIADTVAQKAKEIMDGMNSTTTEKLMNVMKKTKSKSVKRLILLLIQTCDDDHNTTAEASKKALLEALMAVSQKDMDEIAKESDPEGASTISVTEASISTTQESTTEFFNEKQELRRKLSDRRGKSLDFDLTAINSLSNPSTTESIMTTEAVTETLSITKSPPKTTPTAIRRGAKKFLVRTGTTETKLDQVLVIDGPRAEARVASEEPESKTASDTRALELLRSLYTIAARWG